jgi:hypothetical protein
MSTSPLGLKLVFPSVVQHSHAILGICTSGRGICSSCILSRPCERVATFGCCKISSCIPFYAFAYLSGRGVGLSRIVCECGCGCCIRVCIYIYRTLGSLHNQRIVSFRSCVRCEAVCVRETMLFLSLGFAIVNSGPPARARARAQECPCES